MSPPEIVQISIHKALQINYNFCILSGKENTETFPESSLILPPLPVLSLTLWYPTYIRKQLIRRGGGGEGWGNGGGEVKKMQHLTWQLHLLVKIMNTYKASVYEASLSQFLLTYTSNSSCVVSSSR